MTRKSLRTKRIFSIILSLAVALTMMPMSALAADESSPVGNAVAEGGAAQIGETVYSTLPEAVNAAKDGDTIKLLADYKTAEGAGEELTITKSVTLDLNGLSLLKPGMGILTHCNAGTIATTVNGWVVLQLDNLPKVGDTFIYEADYKRFEVKVTKADARKALEINMVVTELPKDE